MHRTEPLSVARCVCVCVYVCVCMCVCFPAFTLASAPVQARTPLCMHALEPNRLLLPDTCACVSSENPASCSCSQMWDIQKTALRCVEGAEEIARVESSERGVHACHEHSFTDIMHA